RLSHSKVCMFIVQSQELLFSVIVPLSLRSQRSQMFFKVSAHVQNVRPFTIRRCSELQDSNLRPLGYEPSELPSCSTPRRGVIKFHLHHQAMLSGYKGPLYTDTLENPIMGSRNVTRLRLKSISPVASTHP